jgi:DnaJ-class molecular chaperone
MKPFGLYREGAVGTCPDCDGAGHHMWGDALSINAEPCPACDGEGRRFVSTEEQRRRSGPGPAVGHDWFDRDVTETLTPGQPRHIP